MIKLSQAKINQYEKRVDAGVRWLKKNRADWLSIVSDESLNLYGTKVCILGQVFDDFWKNVAYYDEPKGKKLLSYAQSAKLGFAEEEGAANYDLLTFVWQQKIKQLKAKA